MNFRQNQKQEELSINLTPLIDVVFLLLIFFMLTTTFSKESQISIKLPKASISPHEISQEAIEITVDSKGNFYVNQQSLINTQTSTLKQAILANAKGKRDMLFIITGDQLAPHQAIVTVIDVAGQLGFSQLKIATSAPDKSAG